MKLAQTMALMSMLAVAACSIDESTESNPPPPDSVAAAPLAEQTFDDLKSLLTTPGDPRDALVALRRDAKAHPEAFANAARARFADAANPLQRWNVALTIGAARIVETVPLLTEIAAAPLPPPDGVDSHGGFPDRSLEQMARTRAIEGLRDLALDGAPEAHLALSELVRIEDRHLRMIVVQSNLAVGGRNEANKTKLRNQLSAEDAWMADVEPRRLHTEEDYR